MSSPSDLPRWTSEHIPEDPSDSSDTDDELVGSQDNTSTGIEEMGNKLSAEYDRDLVLAALDAIPDTPLNQPPTLEGPSSASVDASRSPESVRPSQESASGEPSSESQLMDDANGSARSLPKDIESQSLQAATSKEAVITAHEQNEGVDQSFQGSNEGYHSNQTLPSTKLLSSSKIVNNGPNLAPASPRTLTCPLSKNKMFPSSSTPLPRQFPLSPPSLSQSLSPVALEHNSSDKSDDSEVDDLPELEQLIALTQPIQHESPPRRKNKRRASYESHNNSRSPSSMAPVKRQMSDSPRIPSQPPPKKRRMMNKKTEVPIEYIEILDSSSDDEPPKINKAVESPPPSQLQRPTPKPKKKVLSHTIETPTSTAPSSHRASLSQCQPPKRAKQYHIHPVYWHLDGNVRILIAGTCFKLHRSILARQSKWFEKIFDPSEPESISRNSDDLYDLTDQDITVEDFEEVLRALDDTNACFQGELPFTKLNSLLRVSTTLGFTVIEKYASNALTSMWSADLADVGIDRIECPTETLALARQCALFPVIKRSLYELVRLSNFGQTKIMPGDVSVASTVRLGPYDKDLLLSAREHLGAAWREALDIDRFPNCVAQQGVEDGAGAPAENKPACAATNHALSLVAHHEIIKEYGILGFEYDPVSGLQVLAAAPWKEKGFCQACVEQRQNYWLRERERIWQKLDEWFEV